MPIRYVQPDDRPALQAFLAAVPEADAAFLKEDMTDAGVVDEWLRESRVTRLVSISEDGCIAGVASVARGVGRSDHVADLRLVVDAERRGHGIGRALAQQAVLEAVQAGCRKISVEVGATQQGTIDLFRGIGFTPEALLRDQVRDDEGRPLDLLMLAHLVDDNWSRAATSGQDGAEAS